MRSVQRSAIVTHSPEAMFRLVADVERYPEFLRWCKAASVESSSEQELVAGLTIGVAGLTSHFTTRNALNRPRSMTLSLVDGPFSYLEGRWAFDALGDDGCKVSLAIEFDFSNSAQDLMFGKVFETICNELIGAFTERADRIYDGN